MSFRVEEKLLINNNQILNLKIIYLKITQKFYFQKETLIVCILITLKVKCIKTL